ncbi:uncharacterized protein BP5553_07820 [Venustampulla echinocandica]|uniref:Non-canonical purine NTP phosphatase/PRRC1 domain-containing protein n=1 Tax=Venustampulla echinocandica TaxID=2656787 RepID=A0A370THL7_9HELO|nr:uncharacterized protein BP5553_07820 [Venustampulla echinocandica]RDL34692.1 hypothetical protein BP5553_07820 [Venustampulla echinocandica]
MANIPRTTVGWLCADAGQMVMEVAAAVLDGEGQREKDLQTSPAPVLPAFSFLFFKGADRALCSLQIPTVVVADGTWTTLASQNVASYAFELIRLMTDASAMEIPLLYHTENIVPPRPDPQLPPFPLHHFPTYGNTVLLGIPTENEHKTALLHDFLAERAPDGVKVHVVTVPVASGVGEQPYNEAGVAGAYNRISNALNHLHGAEFVETFKEKLIGTVIVASIESYIQTEDIERPADFGIVVVHNATTQQTRACCSKGTTLPPEYVRRAQHFGSDGDPNHGNVTVGQILAARVPGLDKADWQAVLGGRSRYELLGEATRRLTIPW